MDNPTSLYKYRSLSDEKNKKRVKELFENNKVWFSAYKGINDPFEFQFVSLSNATTNEKIEAYACILRKRDPNLTSDYSKAIATSEILRMGPNGLRKWEEDRLKKFIEFLTEKVGIFSLSECNDNILMWSHYADKHKGICIEFSPKDRKQCDFFAQSLPVNYPPSNELPKINLYKTNEMELTNRSVLTKAINWQYEREWRILDTREGPGETFIPEGIISSVILGCAIGSRERELITELVSAYPTPVNLYEARKKTGYYKLEIHKI